MHARIFLMVWKPVKRGPKKGTMTGNHNARKAFAGTFVILKAIQRFCRRGFMVFFKLKKSDGMKGKQNAATARWSGATHECSERDAPGPSTTPPLSGGVVLGPTLSSPRLGGS